MLKRYVVIGGGIGGMGFGARQMTDDLVDAEKTCEALVKENEQDASIFELKKSFVRDVKVITTDHTYQETLPRETPSAGDVPGPAQKAP